jgi:hypothetical protein
MKLSDKKVQTALRFLETDSKQLLAQLTAETKPVWGTMTAQHMLEHLIWAFEGSASEKSLKLAQTSFLKTVRPVLKSYVLSDIRLPRNVKLSKTKKTIDLKLENFEAARNQLNSSIDKAVNIFLSQPQKLNNHPFAGAFHSAQWLVFHRKHCIHHFTQFGLLQKTNFFI